MAHRDLASAFHRFHRLRASQVVFALQLAIFALIWAGDSICNAIKVPKPQMLSSMQESRMMTIMGIWLVGNMLSAQLLNTGAFEIQHGDQLIWPGP
ncbi:unnamed protein product [Effrenium voratum]|uniref:Uncharacterized protein n=1 Tax=Effrenium voratum TaxID=2562239 RepID=A0AA36MZD6_9DINO|nr:unnamed protein product [Effrenium voratum]CAJ1384183.1 unnamed protein product [Effrenium voratum]CAJ1436107.1 unnamed protein product [Effrenium voratum]